MSSRAARPLVALALLAGPLIGDVAAPTVVRVDAASPPWTLPTVPPRCSTEQIDSGVVAGCVILGTAGLPEEHGWPAPPFPEPQNQTVAPWIDLAVGSSGATVAKVQAALNARGATLATDGEFGAQTLAAVRAYQTANALPVTGIVDAAMAKKLGVQRLIGGTFPPTGWSWLGWGYNSSPALATWEKRFASNADQIGRMRPGSLRAFPDALSLFVGFYAEIQAKGYVINDGGTYVFRCTATTRKDCAGLTRYALSNHAYGLASDINTVKNPQRRYYGIDGASACRTPMVTDMPRWVIQTAEKWGLYWGGYGWSSGCSSPSQWRTSVMRDPMHFEFNGTPAQARAILRHNTVGVCLDVVDAWGTLSLRCLKPGERPPAGTRIAVTTSPPAGATAALVNITATGAVADGYLTAEDCAARSGTRKWSNGNVRAGRTAGATAVVPLDADGRFCIFQSSSFHTVVDVQGWFAPSAVAPEGNVYVPVTPTRVVDSRTTPVCTPDGACLPVGPVPAGTEVISTAPSDLTPVAALANLTASAATAAGYLTADACAALVPGPQTRTSLTYTSVDAATTNLAVVPVAATELGVQFCTWTVRAVHQAIDVHGLFAPASSGGFGYTAGTPRRLVDTRQCRTDPLTSVQRCGQKVAAGGLVRVAAPAGAAVALVNVTATGATAAGSVIAASCTAIGNHTARLATGQVVVGGAAGNLVAVPVPSTGNICVKSSTSTHVIVDLIGTFSPTGDLRFLPISPDRLLDTRSAS